MSFFDPKTPGSTPSAPGTGFTAGATSGGDANKTLSTAFSLPTAQNQAKPTGFFGAGLTGAPAPAFGATAATGLGIPASAASSTGFNLGATSTPNPGTTFGGFGTPASTGTLAPSTVQSFGPPKTTAATGFTLGSTVPASTTATTHVLTFIQPTANPGFVHHGFAPPVTPSLTTGITTGLGTTTPATTGLTLGAPASSVASGFSLTAITSTPASTAFSLGTTASSTTASTAFSLPSVTSTTSSGFNLGSTAPTLTTGFSLGKTAATSIAAVPTTSAPQTTLGNVTTVTASSNSGQTGSMNFCQLEEAINKWTLELEEQEKAFVNQATQVNAWDKLLIANGEKIVTLNEEVERVKLEQQQLEHELDYVVGQQKELQDCLVPLEKELASLSVSDPEREYTYNLAENLDTQLKQMSEDLKEIIEHLNEANRAQDSSDPIVQIGKILNAHMNSLQWLDQRTSILGQKIQQIDQMHQNFRQENERSFSLAYN